MRYVETTPMLINGELVQAASGKTLDSVNPATEEVIGRIPAGGPADVEAAVAAAARAQVEWAKTEMDERAARLRAVAARVAERADEILQLEVRDTGNTISKMRGDVGMGIKVLEYYAGLGLELKGSTIPASQDHLHFTLREPYGVVGRIIPFNHPVMFALSRMAAPLMAGNSIIIKPPEASSLSAGILAEICRDELPAGLVNIVTGTGAEAGAALVRHRQVKRLAFIGSVPTGLAIQRAAAEVCVKHVSLELGGKNPMIIFPDVDPEVAATAAVSAMNFAWQGQSCGSCSRLLLHEDVYDEVLRRIVEKTEQLIIGDPLDPQSQMGPMNSRMQLDKVEHYVRTAHEDGARLMTGGERPEGRQFERGYWFKPTVFAEVTPQIRIGHEEIFGPVLSVFRWSDEQEALRIANSTEYGLTAAIWTNDLNKATRMMRGVKSGYVWINGFSAHHLGTPFGGMGNSGLGREEGIEELLSYTENKTVHIKL
ncbi:aldehyde dehydrogenase family protein [Pseudomonas sp. SST3]|jgi:betaine-aldehyde dehydrogenase|uniref:aldehyde dehydrogenase family protein n=1 Tax=Pseudomonas sp. SST3 TaxID=2267882 RepID=UPI000DFF2F7C|nr:aldehyde dehydrogenase family protein [Pseudomonas sp. SST3]NKQ12725.1 aldehyde dehydrogenase family protein [Pseudomonas sp. SST3]